MSRGWTWCWTLGGNMARRIQDLKRPRGDGAYLSSGQSIFLLEDAERSSSLARASTISHLSSSPSLHPSLFLLFS